MQYMIMIHGDEAGWEHMSEQERKESFEAFMVYNAKLAKAGVLRSAGSLKPSHTATTLKSSQGKITVTDGPFAETREQITGFYVIETDDLDQALDWAGQCPAVWFATLEVRPLDVVPEEL